MPRYAFQIEYNGAPFKGWQRQTALPSVQGAVEDALARLEPGPHTIAAAGRTDTGVHGLGQVAHADLAKPWEPFRLQEALNHHLKPLPVAVVACAQVADDWHARFSARARHYLFRLVTRRPPLTHDAGLAWQVPGPLALAAMQQAAQHLLGHHDFTTFRASECQAKSPVKTLDRLDIAEIAYPQGREFRFSLSARSFLHNQVRSFVGTLERVGAGAWAPDDVLTALQACDRAQCGPVCPPHGLYLRSVDYDEDVFGG